MGAGLATLGATHDGGVDARPVWVIDDTGFPKQGQHSVGVARQYSGTLGKTGNCQVAVSLHQAAAEEVPLNWRLYLPESWTQDAERRAAAGIAAEVNCRRSGNWLWK